MRKLGFALLLLAGTCFAQDAAQFQPAETNVLNAEYPRIDSTGRVQLRTHGRPRWDRKCAG